jgi:acetyl-CoA carboxylase carboxyltransferase component
MIRQLMSYLPANNMEDPPRIQPSDSPTRSEEALDSIIPDNPTSPTI